MLGIVNPVAELVGLAHGVGALAVLDACQRSLLSGGPTTIEIDTQK